jgi:hypothetical protein
MVGIAQSTASGERTASKTDTNKPTGYVLREIELQGRQYKDGRDTTQQTNPVDLFEMLIYGPQDRFIRKALASALERKVAKRNDER